MQWTYETRWWSKTCGARRFAQNRPQRTSARADARVARPTLYFWTHLSPRISSNLRSHMTPRKTEPKISDSNTAHTLGQHCEAPYIVYGQLDERANEPPCRHDNSRPARHPCCDTLISQPNLSCYPSLPIMWIRLRENMGVVMDLRRLWRWNWWTTWMTRSGVLRLLRDLAWR